MHLHVNCHGGTVDTVPQQPIDPRRGSEIRLMLPCSQCQSALIPITSVETLTFYCDNGHESTIEKLLGEQSEAVISSLETLINTWHKDAMALEIITREAKSKGHDKAAEVFRRHVSNLEGRIDLLRKAVDKKTPGAT